jgi:hypothetical protein
MSAVKRDSGLTRRAQEQSMTFQSPLGTLTKRSSKSDVGAALVALALASFGTHLWIFHSYFSSHPRWPIAEGGFVYALNNHGSHVYVTDREVTGLGLLSLTFLISILVVGIVVGRTELAKATTRSTTIIACSLPLYIGAIYFFGQSIASFFVSHGIILIF